MATSVRYSEAFKLQVIEGLATSRYKTIGEAKRALGVAGGNTIERWLVKYGREDLLVRKMRIETVKEKNEKGELKKRIKELETALSDAYIDNSLDHAFLKIACEKIGTDMAAFKKKHALTLSDVRTMRGII